MRNLSRHAARLRLKKLDRLSSEAKASSYLGIGPIRFGNNFGVSICPPLGIQPAKFLDLQFQLPDLQTVRGYGTGLHFFSGSGSNSN